MKEDRIYLLHIRDAIERIRNYTGTGRDDFFRDSKTQDAVLRNIEVIAVERAIDQLIGEQKSG